MPGSSGDRGCLFYSNYSVRNNFITSYFLKGEPGWAGVKGEKGLRGDDTFGSLGLVGFPGLPGLRGLKGEMGDVGEAGIMKRKYKNIRFFFNSK